MSSGSAASASTPTDQLEAGERAFMDNWGMLAEAFGMKREQGRVHALIYIAPEPLDETTIAERVGLPGPDATRHLEELVKWGVVHADHSGANTRYSTHRDPWVWFLRIVAERHHQEFGPVIRAMNHTLAGLNALGSADPAARELQQRARRFTTFVEELSRLIDLFLRLGVKPMGAVFKTLAKIAPRS